MTPSRHKGKTSVPVTPTPVTASLRDPRIPGLVLQRAKPATVRQDCPRPRRDGVVRPTGVRFLGETSAITVLTRNSSSVVSRRTSREVTPPESLRWLSLRHSHKDCWGRERDHPFVFDLVVPPSDPTDDRRPRTGFGVRHGWTTSSPFPHSESSPVLPVRASRRSRLRGPRAREGRKRYGSFDSRVRVGPSSTDPDVVLTGVTEER